MGDILAFFAVHGKTFSPVFSHLFYIFTLRFQSEGLFPHGFLAFMLRNVFSNLRLDEYSTIMFSSSCFIFLFNFLVTWNKLLYSVKCDSNLVLYQIASHVSKHHWMNNICFPHWMQLCHLYHVLHTHPESLHFLWTANGLLA